MSAAVIDPAAHVEWARGVADAVARHYGFRRRSAEWEDVLAEAVVTVLEKAQKFDPDRVPAGGDFDGAFRGWCHPTVRGRCSREAIRQRNGGTYYTRRENENAAVVVVSIEAPASRPGRHDYGGVVRSDFSHTTRPGDGVALIRNTLVCDDAEIAEREDAPPAAPESRRIMATAPDAVPLPAIEAERTVLQARLASLDELRRHITGVVSLVAADPALASLAQAELRAALSRGKGSRAVQPPREE